MLDRSDNGVVVGDLLRPVCGNCGHAAYHCPSSGCNHHEDGEWCECVEYVLGVEVTPDKEIPHGR